MAIEMLALSASILEIFTIKMYLTLTLRIVQGQI